MSRSRAYLRDAILLSAGLGLGVVAVTCAQPAPTNPTTHRAPTISETVAHAFLPAPAFARTDGAGTASIADIAEGAVASVVNISATKVVRQTGGDTRFNDPFFRDFFGPRFNVPQDRIQRGMGSGVIVSADGIVLTNNHVVEDAKEVTVMLNDGREIPAEVAGTDPQSDVAVVRLKEKVKDLKPIQVGASSALRLGDVVLAIGNPFGVGQTVTMGIVSAKGRSGMHILDYEDFIQTDAAINPGNSGGALINMRGELVGINTAILSRSGGSQGIGFAIPTDMARPIMDSLLKHGSVKRGWLGVGIQDLSPQLAETFGTSARQGVLLSEVRPDTPAARSGLRRGDLVLKAAGREVRKADELRNLVAAQAPGSVLPLEIEREGKRLQLGVTLGSRPAEGPPGAGGTPAESSELASQGLSVADLDATARQRFQVPREVRGGVMITGVAPGSPAEQAGLRPGDVIIEVNRRPVTSVREFDAARRSTPTLLLVVREGGTFYVPLRR